MLVNNCNVNVLSVEVKSDAFMCQSQHKSVISVKVKSDAFMCSDQTDCLTNNQKPKANHFAIRTQEKVDSVIKN